LGLGPFLKTVKIVTGSGRGGGRDRESTLPKTRRSGKKYLLSVKCPQRQPELKNRRGVEIGEERQPKREGLDLRKSYSMGRKAKKRRANKNITRVWGHRGERIFVVSTVKVEPAKSLMRKVKEPGMCEGGMGNPLEDGEKDEVTKSGAGRG